MNYPTYSYPAYTGYSAPWNAQRMDFNGMQPVPPQQPSQQPQQNMANTQQMFLCRPVTSREEAIAAQVDFMGPGTIMPDLSHGKIYLKRFNQNTGSSDFFVFSAQAEEPQPAFVPLQDFANLQNTVKQLFDEIEQLKKSSGKAVKKGETNE